MKTTNTDRAETVNASTVITFRGETLVSVCHTGRASDAAAQVSGHVGRSVELADTRFGWTKGRTTWFVSTVA